MILSSHAEDLFIELFCDIFGPDKSQYLFVQYPFVDMSIPAYFEPPVRTLRTTVPVSESQHFK